MQCITLCYMKLVNDVSNLCLIRKLCTNLQDASLLMLSILIGQVKDLYKS